MSTKILTYTLINKYFLNACAVLGPVLAAVVNKETDLLPSNHLLRKKDGYCAISRFKP